MSDFIDFNAPLPAGHCRLRINLREKQFQFQGPEDLAKGAAKVFFNLVAPVQHPEEEFYWQRVRQWRAQANGPKHEKG